jgi:hypothetical protein
LFNSPSAKLNETCSTLWAALLICLATMPCFGQNSTSPPVTTPPPAPPPAQIDQSVKVSNSLSADDKKQIADKLQQRISDLAAGTDPVSQTVDRKWFIDSLNDGGGNPCSAEFYTEFATQFNQQMLAAISAPNANLRAKIEAGLAAAEIAKATGGTEVAPLVVKLLNDPSPSVALIAIKAAEVMVPVVLNKIRLDAADKQMLDGIVDAVQNHPEPPVGGPIAEEAYQAFQGPAFGGNPPALLEDALVPRVLRLEQIRMDLYKGGVSPESPEADATGVVILLSTNVWPVMKPAQQQEALTDTAGLITNISQSASIGPPQRLISCLRTTGRELAIFSGPQGAAPDTDLYDGVTALASLGMAAPPQLIQATSDDAVKAITAFMAKSH